MNWQIEKENFHNFILNNDIIGFFEQPLKLSSGRLSYWYVNWRNISSDVYLLDQLTDYILSFVDSLGLNPQCFYGVPEGATKLGIITQFKWARKQKNYNSGTYSLSMGRGKPKGHGDPKDKFFVGTPRGKTVILEDVTTTGESLITTIKQLRKFNVKIIASIGLTNRNELRDDGKSVEEIIKEQNLQYYAMSNAVDLLPRIEMNDDIKKQLEEYFKKYGTTQLEFKTIKM